MFILLFIIKIKKYIKRLSICNKFIWFWFTYIQQQHKGFFNMEKHIQTYQNETTWTAIVTFSEDGHIIYEIELEGYGTEDEAYWDAESFEP